MDGDFTWIPKCFTVTDSSSDYVSGWVVNESELSSLLEAHQRAFLCSFVSWSDDVKKKEKSERRLLWMHDGLSSSDYPYIVDRSVVYNCQYGKSRKPSKRESKVEKNETDHEYIRKKRFLIQNTKKVECDAKIYVRHINRYIDYAVPENANRRVRQLQLDDLTVKLRIGNIQAETVITVKLPLKGAHKNHLLTIESGFSKSMNSKLREYISNHVQMGVTSVPYIRKLLKFYVEHELTQTEIVQPSPNDRSYFPTNRDIYNCVHAALVAGRYSN